MEIVCQYGFIVLFSAIFPPAALMSSISNWVQIKNQVNNMGRIRRFKAEVSDGIGNWLQCIQILSQLSIIVNCAVVYFTSHYYKKMFVASEQVSEVPYIAPRDDWGFKDFLILVLAVEHGMILIKILVEQLIDDTPFHIAQGLRERDALQANYSMQRSIKAGLLDDAEEEPREGSGLGAGLRDESLKDST